MQTSRRASLRFRLFIASLFASTLASVADVRAAKVDFLWVIDNSPSMAGEQQVLSSTASLIQDRLEHAQCDVDWRMAVAYTDLHRAPTNNDVCDGAAGPGRRRLCPFTNDMDAFRFGTPECAYAMPGTCGDGSERGFNASRVAIERFVAGQGCEPVPNSSCELRPDASLSVIFMTDTGEQTPSDTPPPYQPDNSVASWANFFSDYDHFRPGDQRAQVHGILCPFRPDGTDKPCSDRLADPALYDRYSDLIQLMGGVEGSIRDDDENHLSATIASMVDATIARACCGNGSVDPGEQCDDGNGNDGDCCSSTCQFESAATVCRGAAGACDAVEHCTGSSAVCPADSKSTGVCRGSAGACDVAETCDGVSNTCPSDHFVVDGTSCNDGSACSRHDVCRAGVCTGEDPVSCTTPDQCHVAGTCNPATGLCSNPTAKPNGTSCNDGNSCTRQDSCQAGTCTGSDPVVCTASDQCHVAGSCNPANGICSNPAKVNGSACNDGSACSRQDTCQAGSCVGGDPVVCTAQDSCHDAGSCNPSTGTCSSPVRADGSTCDDGNGCTQTDRCDAGTCLGSNPVTCNASDACHVAGTCDPETGTCSNPAQPDGTSCDDSSACTRQDACQAGVCVGADPVVCQAADACNSVGTCNPTTGTCDTWYNVDGSTCDDGNACTQGDSCWGGHCMPGTEVRCNAPDSCHAPTACDAVTGACSIVAMPDGTSCDDNDACTKNETCWGQTCQAGSPVSCEDKDACTADSCESATGCSHTRLSGLEGVSCHCDNGLDTLWCGNSVPSLVQKPYAKACKLLRRAHSVASAKKSRKLMLKAKKVLKKTRKAVTKAKKKHMITGDCAMDMYTVMDDSTSRVKTLTTNRVRP